MFNLYRILSLTILALFLITMTLVPLFSSMATVKSTKAAQEELSLNVPQSKADGTASN